MALATLHLAAIPVFAGLLAGSGAVATYVAAPSSPVAVSAAASPVLANPAQQTGLPCTAQAWPYIDPKCMPSANDQKRTVRLVSAPRSGEAGEASASAPVSSTASAADARAAEPSLTTSDTVLRQPQPQASKDISEPQASKSRTKRGETRRPRDRRWATQSYQVPTEFQGRADRQVIVVRPLRLEAFR
jgi:hypothetical protein